MVYMKNLILSTCILLFLTTNMHAQSPYSNAVGVRAGYSSGLSFKHFVSSDFALDAMAVYNQHGFQVSLLYAYQFSPYGKERLQYYAGLGPHAGNWSDEFAIGAAALAGAEFIFRKAPLILGMEWKPMINIFKQFDYGLPDFAVTFKVILN